MQRVEPFLNRTVHGLACNRARNDRAAIVKTKLKVVNYATPGTSNLLKLSQTIRFLGAEEFGEDAEFLAKVGAVIEAINKVAS